MSSTRSSAAAQSDGLNKNPKLETPGALRRWVGVLPLTRSFAACEARENV